ncbi:MAG: T9SS type A sorting domain-containing protein [Candidatus Cyclonatronum sp.]|uniref:LamG-like jellyroll fold domain-containing protein n=1 Tax=Cyclonatronum sp. TaxID=3024185 RepID=UPI0025B8E188|nr:LamG-like jellyroll fold domain-containing protein [Cyclonatronum sp.]MCH8487873.1 T9SS type A sorting domain-containing protein [Cyclonatronum sp.]
MTRIKELLLTLIAAATLLACPLYANAASAFTTSSENPGVLNGTDFAGGDGLSPATAFQISNWHHLNNIRSHMTSYFVLLNDLNSGTEGYGAVASPGAHGGIGWPPIGVFFVPFEGSIDGGGFTIADLHIVTPPNPIIPAFIGYAQGASITDLHLRNVNISGTQFAGGFFGVFRNSVMERVSVSGNITVPSDDDCCFAAGIALTVEGNSTLTEVMADVNITGAHNLGAIASIVQEDAIITKAIARGTLTGNNQLGGIAAENSGTISNSYSTVTIQGATNSGGMVAIDSGHIINSWVSAGSPNGQIRPVTGVCNSCTRTNVYYNSDGPASLSEPSSASPLPEVLMLEDVLFLGFDFTPTTGVWQTGTAFSPTFPYLQAFTYDNPTVINGINPLPGLQLFYAGSGTASDPYLISSWYHLHNVRHRPVSHHKLINDLNSNTTAYNELASPQADGGAGWFPLSDFYGNFDGDGFTIRNLFVNRPGFSNVGLFSVLRGNISNLSLLDVHIISGQHAGALAGRGQGFSVFNVSTSGTISAPTSTPQGNSGGLIGYVDFTGNVNDVHTNVHVSGSFSGGVFGYVMYQNGPLNMNNIYTLATFGNVTNRGSIIGRILMFVQINSTSGILWDESCNNCISRPIGSSFSTLQNFTPVIPPGFQGLNGTQMRTRSVFENAGFDFDNTWQIQEGDYESYPYLQVHRYNEPGDVNPENPIPALRLKLETLTEDPFGPGTAMAFNGTSDYINTRMSDTMLGIPQSSFTVEAWIRVNNTSGDNPILGHATGMQTNQSLHLIVRNNALNMGFYSNDLTGGPKIQAGRWHHVAFVYDNDAGEQRLFVDGAADGVRQATAFDGHPAGLNAPLKIGRWLSAYFDGSMNDLRIWQGARTQAEIQANMNRSLPRNTGGLLANYTFNEAQKNGYFDADFTGNRVFEVTQNAPASIAFLVNNPNWFAPVMPLGQHSVFVAENQTQTLADAGLSLEAAPGSGSVSLYRYGTNAQGFITLSGSDPVAAEFGAGTAFVNRSDAVFGVFPSGSSVSGTLTLNYSFYEDGALQLLQRNSTGGSWERASGWVHDPVNRTYTFSGTIAEQQLALTRPVTQLQSRVYFVGDDAAGNAQLAIEVRNSGLSDVASVPVQLTASGISNLSSENPALSGSTWTIPAVMAGGQQTLLLSGELEDYLGELSISVSSDHFELEAGSVISALGRAFPEAYGAEAALALGSGSYLSTGKTVAELGLTNSSFTVETWVQFNSLNGDKGIMGAGENGGFSDHLHLIARNQRLHMGFWSNDTSGSTVLETGRWYHAAFVYDADAEEQRIYLNGGLEATGTERPPLTGNREMMIGRFVEVNFLDGFLDEFRIWNRALPQAEIQQHMNLVVQPADARFQDLTMYLRFDQRSGTAVADLAGSTLNTFAGDPQWVTLSSAPIGQFGGSVQPGQPFTAGPAGAEASVTDLSGGSLSVVVSATNNMADRTHTQAGENFPGSIEARRRGVSWALQPENGSTSGTITLNYGFSDQQAGLNAATEYTQGLVERVLYREAAGQPWQIQTDWVQDDAAMTFTRSGPVVAGEYSTALVIDTIVPVAPNQSGWRIIGAPGPLATYEEVLSGLWTQGYPGAANSEDGDSNVYLYNETTRSWQIPGHASHIFGTTGSSGLSSGRAALMFMYEDDAGLELRHTGFPLITEAVIELTNTNTNPDANPNASGWHLVANPYPFPISWEAVTDTGLSGVNPGIFIFDTTLFENEGGYRLYQPGAGGLLGETGHSGIIPPFQGFWVQANRANGQTSAITVNADQSATGGSLHRSAQPDALTAVTGETAAQPAASTASPSGLLIALRAEQLSGNRSDVALLSLFHENAAGLSPLYRPAVLTQHYLHLDLLDENGFPAVMQYQAPEIGHTISIPLNIRSSRSGLHRLSLSEEWLSDDEAEHLTLYLLDTQTGERSLWQPGSSIELYLEASLSRSASDSGSFAAEDSGPASGSRAESRGSLTGHASPLREVAQAAARVQAQEMPASVFGKGDAPRALPAFWRAQHGNGSDPDAASGLHSGSAAQAAQAGLSGQPAARFLLEIHYGTETEGGPADELPLAFGLDQNYPNPFNPGTSIRYALPEDAEVRLEVFNLLGQRVALLHNGPQTAGFHTLSFDASRLSSGVYLYRLQTVSAGSTHTETRKMTLIK